MQNSIGLLALAVEAMEEIVLKLEWYQHHSCIKIPYGKVDPPSWEQPNHVIQLHMDSDCQMIHSVLESTFLTNVLALIQGSWSICSSIVNYYFGGHHKVAQPSYRIDIQHLINQSSMKVYASILLNCTKYFIVYFSATDPQKLAFAVCPYGQTSTSTARNGPQIQAIFFHWSHFSSPQSLWFPKTIEMPQILHSNNHLSKSVSLQTILSLVVIKNDFKIMLSSALDDAIAMKPHATNWPWW